MRQLNVVLDLYSGAVCLILGAYLFLRKRHDKQNFYFFLMCVFNLGMILGDIPNWACEGLARTWYPFALKYGVLLYFLCAAPLLLAFLKYIIEYLSPKVRIARSYWNAAAVLCGIYIFCCVLSLFNGMFFRIDENNLYHRGSWFLLSQLIPFILYGIDTFIIIANRKFLKKSELWILLSYVALPIAAELIQIMNYGIALLNTAVTLAILLIFVNIQSDRELLLEKKEHELTESRIDIMLSQIQPHFLYNVLTSIRKLCEKDPPQARQAIGEFAKFLRVNMDSLTNKAPIPFEQELIHTKSYLSLEQRRFGDRLHVVYDIEVSSFAVPPLTLQPIAENAVRHGIINCEEGGTVTIHTEENKDAYVITVSDDGAGFSCLKDDEDIQHIGITNVRSRLAALCGGELEVHSTSGSGTTVIIRIPKEGECL